MAIADGTGEGRPPSVVLVAAMGRNRAIGVRNRLPWRLASDLRHYRKITLGKPMIMGRKTLLSIGRLLPGRETIVVTRDRGFVFPGAHVAGDLASALALAGARAAAMGADEIIVAGGGEIYAQTICGADALKITLVDLAPDGDAFFPAIDPAVWRESRREAHPASPGDEAPFAFIDYIRHTA